jgi:hypothetical protein
MRVFFPSRLSSFDCNEILLPLQRMNRTAINFSFFWQYGKWTVLTESANKHGQRVSTWGLQQPPEGAAFRLSVNLKFV